MTIPSLSLTSWPRERKDGGKKGGEEGGKEGRREGKTVGRGDANRGWLASRKERRVTEEEEEREGERGVPHFYTLLTHSLTHSLTSSTSMYVTHFPRICVSHRMPHASGEAVCS